MYSVGQFFQLDGRGEIYILTNTGDFVTLIGIESGNRWTDNVHGYEFEANFTINESEFDVVTAGQPHRFTPVQLKVNRVARTIQPAWEV